MNRSGSTTAFVLLLVLALALAYVLTYKTELLRLPLVMETQNKIEMFVRSFENRLGMNDGMPATAPADKKNVDPGKVKTAEPAAIELPDKVAETKKTSTAAQNAVPMTGAPPATVVTPPTKPAAQLTVAGTINETNKQRLALIGTGYVLRENEQLDAAAEARIADMFRNQYFDHASPDGVNMSYCIKTAGYAALASGENLAMGDFSSDAALVDGWMNSPGHRANILKASYREIGVAVRYGSYLGRQQWLAVQLFATPAGVCASPDDSLLAETNRLEAELKSKEKMLNDLAATIDEENSRADSLERELVELRKDPIGNIAIIGQKQNTLENLVKTLNANVDTYNAGSSENKTIYSIYKQKIDAYNAEVKSYNTCLGGL